MSNTTIAIKKSSTPSAEPSVLANGELAINFADGKLFYKNATGQIVSFTSGSNSFGTVNANGTLIVADTVGDILTLEAGDNITITGDAINDKITISSTGGGGGNVTVATSQIKDLTSNDYVVTNVATIATVVDSSVAVAAFNKANNALANTSDVSFNGNLYFPTGNVGIGTTTPNTKLDVVGNITSSNTVFAIHFDNVSDLSFKENIQTINNSIQILSQLNPVSFDWKNTKNKSYGLIAQEVEKIIPTIVHQKPDGTKTINYIEIIAFLIQAIKEQQKQIDDINTHINNAE